MAKATANSGGSTTTTAPTLALPSVRDVKLSQKQDTLLLSLERRVQLHLQAERNASLLHKQQHPEASNAQYAASVKEFLKQNTHPLAQPTSPQKGPLSISGGFHQFATQVDLCGNKWKSLYDHAHKSFALVEEMENSHEQVVSKTQALYDSFENILQQVEALTMRVELIAAPLPHFLAIDGHARTLGFGVKFATPAPVAAPAATASLLSSEPSHPMSNSGGLQQPVQVFQHKRSIDPTTIAFQHALEQIDVAVAYLESHKEYKDAVCYIEAYRTLTAGAIQCLKDYATSGLDAARDAVLDAVAVKSAHARTASSNTATAPVSPQEIDETSPYYVHFQLVAPSLTSVARQLERLASSHADAANVSAYMANVMALADVCNSYAAQRVALLTPVLTAYWESLVNQSPDIVSVLRVAAAYLVRVCDAEFRLFCKLFGRLPSDELFIFKTSEDDDHEDEHDQEQTAFERLIFQLSGVLYNIMRPQMILQKELEVFCELVQILQMEIIETMITPRVQTLGYVEPVMHRMVQDAQERLILCVQKFIRDEIEGFTPTPSDLAYPQKLIEAENGSGSSNLYATWYPSLERTLLCLSKVYHFVDMEIFEELAQDAIQICTISLKMASADLTVSQGKIQGFLFLVKHLLTLREQITPFDIKFSVKEKALDFTSSADAMNHLLSDVKAVFSFSMENNALVGFFTQGIPQIQETTSDVKKDLEIELKKSCTGFIDAVLEQLAKPLLVLMKQIAELQKKTSGNPVEWRKYEFMSPQNVATVLAFVSKQVNDTLPGIQATIHLYLRNASTETILFKPIQRNLVDAVENLKTLLEQNYSREDRQPCEAAFQMVLQQLRAL